MPAINTDKPHIVIDDKPTASLSTKHLAMVRRGNEITRQMKDLKAELDGINTTLKKDIGPGHTLVLPTECRTPIAESVSQSIKDSAALKAHLGTRKFNRLVACTESFKPTAELLTLAQSDAAVNACLGQRVSVAVKYLAINAKK